MVRIRGPVAALVAAVAALGPVAAPGPVDAQEAFEAPVCGTPGQPLVLEPDTPLTVNLEKTYVLEPFRIPATGGPYELSIAYTWSPLETTVIDLGLWDPDGVRTPDGFRGWSGSREGRSHEQQAPVQVSPYTATRGYLPGPVDPGVWNVELGLADLPDDDVATYRVEVTCTPESAYAGEPRTPFADQPVEPGHVADPEPGWYFGDFHVHGYHSSPNGPTWDQVVQFARAAQLDILPVTEYVTNEHWRELGPVQEANPDLLIWPGREVITYFGHAIVLGETPSTVEYRVGFEGIGMRDIQQPSVMDGALFGVAHPTIFPEATFGNLCRGCEFQLWDQLDLDLLDTIEVVTGGARTEFGGEVVPNVFVPSAVATWENLLQQGHRVTAVSGSDDKAGTRYGATRTAVYADELSIDAVHTALLAGHAYVQGLGVASPTVEFSGVTPDGETGIFGDTLVGEEAELTITVTGGAGQVLVLKRNGQEVATLPITADPFGHVVAATRAAPEEEGPLGTFWGFEVRETAEPDAVRTVIANPIFLADEPAPEPEPPAPPPTAAPSTTAAPAGDDGSGGDDVAAPPLDDDDGSGGLVPIVAGLGLGLVVVAGAWYWGGRRRDS